MKREYHRDMETGAYSYHTAGNGQCAYETAEEAIAAAAEAAAREGIRVVVYDPYGAPIRTVGGDLPTEADVDMDPEAMGLLHGRRYTHD